ncbi:MAG: hypothetical protein A4S08_04040 [Proteobacteria bacterium SG_bin4]|nr:MAG: hypothetical protein A4S08_04040 [Proteobacteria bacterium SG_bin4]
MCGAVLGFIRKDSGMQLPGETIDGYKQVFARFMSKLPFQQREPLGIEVRQFARISFVVAFCFTLETILDRLLNFGQALKAVLQHLESLVGTVMWRKFLKSGSFEYVVDRWTADVETFRQLRYLSDSGLIKTPDLLAI